MLSDFCFPAYFKQVPVFGMDLLNQLRLVLLLMATRNPANSPVEGTVVYPIIYKVNYTSQVVQDFSHQQ